jgi:hypothetical protein
VRRRVATVNDEAEGSIGESISSANIDCKARVSARGDAESGVPLKGRIKARLFYKTRLRNAVGGEVYGRGEGERGRERKR